MCSVFEIICTEDIVSCTFWNLSECYVSWFPPGTGRLFIIFSFLFFSWFLLRCIEIFTTYTFLGFFSSLLWVITWFLIIGQLLGIRVQGLSCVCAFAPNMQMYGGPEVRFYLRLTLALDGDEWLICCSRRFAPEERIQTAIRKAT